MEEYVGRILGILIGVDRRIEYLLHHAERTQDTAGRLDRTSPTRSASARCFDVLEDSYRIAAEELDSFKQQLLTELPDVEKAYSALSSSKPSIPKTQRMFGIGIVEAPENP